MLAIGRFLKGLAGVVYFGGGVQALVLLAKLIIDTLGVVALIVGILVFPLMLYAAP